MIDQNIPETNPHPPSNCLQCNQTITTRFASRFCSPKCALTWRNLHDEEFRTKIREAIHAHCYKKIEKEIIENLYFKEGKTQQEIAQELGVSTATIKDRFKFFRIETRKRLLEKSKLLISERNKEWTKKKCFSEFRKIKKRLGRTPMSKELTEIGHEGLRHAIFRKFGDYSAFLFEGRFGIPKPVLGKSRKSNFALLASEAAIRYRQNGEWSSSEIKLKNILEKMGLLENLDYWHNFKVLSPLKGEYKLDFYLPRWKTVIECDSFWHDIGESRERDKLRDEWIKEKLGCETLRFKRFGQKGLAQLRKFLRGKLENQEKPQKAAWRKHRKGIKDDE